MRWRVLSVWCSTPDTSTLRPCSGRPSVLSTSAVKASSPRTPTQPGTRKPATTAAGHRRRRWLTVCTSPLASLKLSSACSSAGPVSAGRPWTSSRAAPCRSVLAASLSATRVVPSLPSSSSGCALPGASKLKSSWPANCGTSGRSSADSFKGAPAIGPPASALSCAAKASCAGATSTPEGPDRRASTSGTRKASTRKVPLDRRDVPRCSETS